MTVELAPPDQWIKKSIFMSRTKQAHLEALARSVDWSALTLEELRKLNEIKVYHLHSNALQYVYLKVIFSDFTIERPREDEDEVEYIIDNPFNYDVFMLVHDSFLESFTKVCSPTECAAIYRRLTQIFANLDRMDNEREYLKKMRTRLGVTYEND